MLKCLQFNIYEQDEFRAQLSGAWKKVYNLGTRPFVVLIYYKIIGLMEQT